jgi:hypothetical protein
MTRHLLLALAACSHPTAEPALAAPDAPDPIIDAASCGQTLDVSTVQPDVMIVLDRSCSMTQLLSGSTDSKWQAAVAAVEDATMLFPQRIRWGLTLFPDKTGDNCAQEDIQVPIADGTASSIQTLLTAALDSTNTLYPSGPCATNIDTGIETAATDPGLSDPAHPGNMVLVTDGNQSGKCTLGGGNAGTEAAIQAAQQRGVTTYVVGFGSDVDTAELDKLAMLGGAPHSGAHAYYQADTAGDLQQAIGAITSAVVTCTYRIDPAPQDLDQTFVWFDHTQLVPRDPSHAAGWDYDPASLQLTLYGSYCDQLESGGASKIDVIFGCPQPPVF